MRLKYSSNNYYHQIILFLFTTIACITIFICARDAQTNQTSKLHVIENPSKQLIHNLKYSSLEHPNIQVKYNKDEKKLIITQFSETKYSSILYPILLVLSVALLCRVLLLTIFSLNDSISKALIVKKFSISILTPC